MPFASVTSNVPEGSVNVTAASLALAKVLEETVGYPEVFMMVPIQLGVPITLGLTDEPAAYVQIRSIGHIDAERNPKIISAVTNTVSEHLKVPASRIYVVLEDVKVGNWGANGTAVIPPSE